MTDFWNKIGNYYPSFKAGIFQEDMISIETSLLKIIDKDKYNKKTILDIGSGDGIDIYSLVKKIYTNTQLECLLDVIEPNSEMLDLCRKNIAKHEYGGFLRKIYNNVTEINKQKYDIIIFKHSSYYISESIIRMLYEQNLNSNGLMIFICGNNFSELASKTFRDFLVELLKKITNNCVYDQEIIIRIFLGNLIKNNFGILIKMMRFFMKCQVISLHKEIKNEEFNFYVKNKIIKNNIFSSKEHIVYVKK